VFVYVRLRDTTSSNTSSKNVLPVPVIPGFLLWVTENLISLLYQAELLSALLYHVWILVYQTQVRDIQYIFL